MAKNIQSLAGCLIIATFAMAGVLNAQCQSGACGPSSCNSGSCNGQCSYCVEGICTPRKHTFGFYNPNWRKWPEPAPQVVRKYRPSEKSLGMEGNLELPSAESESDIDPEFPHLKKRPEMGTLGLPSELPQDSIDAFLEPEPLGDMLPTSVPTEPAMEASPVESESMPALETPIDSEDLFDEGSTSRNSPLNAPRTLQTRPQDVRNEYRTVRYDARNPLRKSQRVAQPSHRPDAPPLTRPAAASQTLTTPPRNRTVQAGATVASPPASPRNPLRR